MMEAKEFLGRIKKLDRMIENKGIERQQWLAIALGTTGQLGGERVQSSGNQQKMADAVNHYVDIERELDECIDKLVDARREVISVIEQLDATEYDLLHKIYVQYYTLTAAADVYDRTYGWAAHIHKRALKKVQTILDNY